jgi:hypothetical protein
MREHDRWLDFTHCASAKIGRNHPLSLCRTELFDGHDVDTHLTGGIESDRDIDLYV